MSKEVEELFGCSIIDYAKAKLSEPWRSRKTCTFCKGGWVPSIPTERTGIVCPFCDGKGYIEENDVDETDKWIKELDVRQQEEAI